MAVTSEFHIHTGKVCKFFPNVPKHKNYPQNICQIHNYYYFVSVNGSLCKETSAKYYQKSPCVNFTPCVVVRRLQYVSIGCVDYSPLFLVRACLAHSLLQFVKGAGSFASEMADAVLNSLTAGRHEKFMGKYHTWEETERLGRTKKEEGNKKEEKEGEGEREDTKDEAEKGEGEKRGGKEEGEEDVAHTGSGNDGRGEEDDDAGGRGEEREVSGNEGEDGEETRHEATETVGEDQEECAEEAEEREDWFGGGGVEEGEEEGGEGREEGGETGTHSLSLSPDNSNGATSSSDSEEGEEGESPEESKSEVRPLGTHTHYTGNGMMGTRDCSLGTQRENCQLCLHSLLLL